MYRVYLDDHLLFDPTVEELVILDPKLDLQDNKSGGFDFTMPPTHPLYNAIEKHKSQITVTQDGRVLFKGRVLDDEVDFNNFSSVICEGALSYFNDSVVRPYLHQGSVDDYVIFLITQHNSQMGDYEHKKFKVGNINVTDPNDYIHRSSRVYPSTWEELEDKLLDTLGGHLVLRYEDDGTYIDYLADSDYISRQKIEFGENLLDIKRFTKGEDIATAIIPLGATVSGEDEEERKLTIESVNNGKDYLYDETAVQLYGGYIFKTVEYQDITLPQNLIQRGRAELAQAVRLGLTIELTAFDMSLLDINVDDFRVFEYVEVRSEPHDLSALFLVTKMTIHLTDPSRNKLTVGKNFNYLTTDQNTTEKSVSQLKSTVLESESISLEIINDVSDIIERTDNYWQVNNDNGGTPNMVAGNKNNDIPWVFTGSKIGGGDNHQAYANHATISGGINNLVTEINGTVGGGKQNTTHGQSATIAGGENGIVTGSHGVVGGGKDNGVYGNYGAVLGGENNDVGSSHGVIVGGKNNITNSPYAAILDGENNETSSTYATVINGKDNESNGESATVINGQRNSANYRYSSVLNGEDNDANAQYSSVLAGKNNASNGEASTVVSGKNNQSVGEGSAVIGRDAVSIYPGSFGQGFGKFDERGRAQSQRIKLVRTTTNTSPVTLGFDNTDRTIYHYNSFMGVYHIDYLIMAQSESGVIKVWKMNAVLGNVGAGLTILNTPSKEVVIQTNVSAETWDIGVEIGPENLGGKVDVELKVTGGSEQIKWLADVDVLELTYMNE